MPGILPNLYMAVKRMGSLRLLLSLLIMAAVFLSTLTPDMSFAASTDSTCAKNIVPPTTKPGEDIVKSVFDSINALLGRIGMTMYNGFVTNTTFSQAINAIVALYVAIFGIMIMLGLVQHGPGEIFGRLLRIAAFAALLNPAGWLMFDQFVGRLFLGGMNELIASFTSAATGVPAVPAIPSATPIPGISFLDTSAMSAFTGPMNIVFSPFFLISIVAMFFLKPTGALMAGVMGWAFISFATMMFGAMLTYVRSVVGLIFLFGIAPLFIAFMLFTKTRHIFYGWLNQVVSFALAPVMLFAFLSFYAVLVNSSLIGMFSDIDFCWTRIYSIPGTAIDIGGCRPAKFDRTLTPPQWVLISGDYEQANGLPLDLPLNFVNILYFLILSGLGTQFATYINKMSASISNGIGPTINTGEGMRSFFTHKVGDAGTVLMNQLKGGAGKNAGVGTPLAGLRPPAGSPAPPP